MIVEATPFCLWLTTKVLAVQLPAWGLWLLWQYVLQPYFFSKQPEVISFWLMCVHCVQNLWETVAAHTYRPLACTFQGMSQMHAHLDNQPEGRRQYL